MLMKCPVCNRDLAPTLSICLTCGAMMNDSVREEHQVKVSTSGNLPKIEQKSDTLTPPRPLAKEINPYAVPPPAITVPTPVQRRAETAGISPAKTCQTLVDFQNKNTAMPEWRLQMQNAVRQRRGGPVIEASPVSTLAVSNSPRMRTNGMAALKVEIDEPLGFENVDPRLNNALRRIADSKSSFQVAEPAKPTFTQRNVQPKSFPFDVVAPNANAVARPAELKSIANVPPKPTLVAPLKLDTNKLPKLETIQPKTIEKVEDLSIATEPSKPIFESIKRIFINAERPEAEEEEEVDLIGDDEIEDLAPLSMRFNAGLFDLIIGMVVSMVLLSPVALSGNNWVSISGLLLFAAVCSIVMFAYLTASVGFYGKTLGMKIFSLEVVDAEENQYPSLQQSAINSFIYIGSLACLGLGFVTVFFNEEKRAIHDLLAGTIVVRQF